MTNGARDRDEFSREEDYRDFEQRDIDGGWPYDDGAGAGAKPVANAAYGEKLKQVDALTAQVQQLQQQQNQIVQVLNSLNQQIKSMQNTVMQAVNRLDDTEEELRNKPKGLFGR